MEDEETQWTHGEAMMEEEALGEGSLAVCSKGPEIPCLPALAACSASIVPALFLILHFHQLRDKNVNSSSCPPGGPQHAPSESVMKPSAFDGGTR